MNLFLQLRRDKGEPAVAGVVIPEERGKASALEESQEKVKIYIL